MQTATSETESKSCYISICVHHYTLRAPCPKGQGICEDGLFLDRHTLVLDRIPATNARLAKQCHV